MTRRVSRRRFLQAVAAGAAAAPFAHVPLRADRAANGRITLGFIGVGTQNRGHLRSFLGNADVQVVAVCDVVAERRDDAKRITDERYTREAKGDYKGCTAHADFRDLLARKDIDAVVIATPDHWHAIPCILAARAGKDIYCEKPLTHHVAEGRRIVDEVARAKVIFQTGSQQRSEYESRFRKAVELVRNGRIGKVHTVHIGIGDPAVPCDLAEEPVPPGTDWDFWLGPAPKRGYNAVLCPKGVHRGYPNWRKYKEYAGGGVADFGAHHYDIAQWALDMDNSGPVKIEPPEGDAKRGLKLTYANGVVIHHGGRVDCQFEGTDGVIKVSRASLTTEPEKLLTEPLPEGGWRAYPSNNHRQNWVECVKSRKPTICPAEVGHRSATVCHLTNIGYWLRRPLRWDPAAERFVGDEEANRLLTRQPREPWDKV
ncbi:MAG TPA: Gfo/Idh/MocA family oxidoreductase [Gemmataceae bacterium]